MKNIFIVNTASRTGKTKETWEKLKEHLEKLEIEYEVRFTKGPGDATAFAKAVSTAALCRYPDMELYIKQTDYDSSLLPGDNLRNLTDGLERKKANAKSKI